MNYKDNEEYITKSLTSVIDGMTTTNISLLEKTIENIMLYVEEKGFIDVADCEWFVPFLNNKMMIEEEILKIFNRDVMSKSLVDPAVNSKFTTMLEASKVFNNSIVKLW